MKTMRMLVGVVLGMLTMTVIAESIEFAIVSMMLEQSFDYLRTHQEEYFATRNQTGVLIAKLLYNSIAAIGGGYVTTWVTRHQVRSGVALLTGIQVSALVWGGFFSGLAQTGPPWVWLALILVMPVGMYVGYTLRLSRSASLRHRRTDRGTPRPDHVD